MMLLRRLLFFMALLLTVACVCMAAGEAGEVESTCSDPSTVSDDGACSDTGKKGCKCENETDVEEQDLSECAEPSEKEICPTEDGGSEENCRKDTKPTCRSKEPAPPSPKEPAPEGERGPTGTVGAAGAAGPGTGAGGNGAEGTGALPAAATAASTSSVPGTSQATKPDQREADLAASAPGKETGGQTAVEDHAESSDNSTAGGNATTADAAAEQPSSSTTTVTESTSGSDTS
ncbi:uncharacterized protein TM35_000451110, partial [Trypanosoma theileri]